MDPDRQAMQTLADRLLGNDDRPLSAAELDAALSWLAGSGRCGGDVLVELLGQAPDQPRRRVAVYDQVDLQLFGDGELDLAGAHLDIDVDHDTRRARYRRLMAAFHPDRYPDHGDWLTSRSQAVHASYARFRRGQPPESREAEREDATPARRATPERRARPDWRRARRSARLTPMAGPGPITRLRSWLLGVENLQQRILVGLAVVCLVPVLYAYFAYKPYRAIQGQETPVADTASPPAVDAEPADSDIRDTGDDARLADGKSPAEAPATDEPAAPETATEAARVDTDAALADAQSLELPAIRPIHYRRLESESAAEPEAETAPEPKTVLTALSEWTAPLVEAAGEFLEQEYEPQVADSGVDGSNRGSEQDSAPSPPDSAAPTLETDSPVSVAQEPSVPEAAPSDDEGIEPPTQPPAEIEREAARTERTIAAAGDAPETPSPSPESESLPDPPASETGPEAESAPGSGSPGKNEPASEPAVASESATEAATEADRAVAETITDEAQDETSRRRIEELLAGYRRSFENGWLEDFLDHFTESPRENRHEGLGWFRSNYGWLFENSEQRRLDIDILDIDRADDHWTVVTRFEMHVDYPNRPTMHSNRKVHYRIKSNEHEQFRIAAIEY